MAQFKTFTTEPGQTVPFLNATDWTYVSLQLDTAGPCIVGNVPSLGPIAAGRGVQLSNIPTRILVRPGEQMYVYADTIESVGVILEPMPFIEGILRALSGGKAGGGGGGDNGGGTTYRKKC